MEGKNGHTWPSVCPMEVKTFPYSISTLRSTARILGCTGLYMPSLVLVSIRTRLYIYPYTYERGFHLTYILGCTETVHAAYIQGIIPNTSAGCVFSEHF